VSRRKGDTDTRGGYGGSLDIVSSKADIVSGFKFMGELLFKGCGFTLESGCTARISGARASFPGWPVCLISRVCLLCMAVGYARKVDS
jgi:hypothetical protein